MAFNLPRELLETAFPGQSRTQRAFEELAQTVNDTSAIVTANLEATGALQDATVVTLSANDAFTNERILGVTGGLTIEEDGTQVVVGVGPTIPKTIGGYQITFNVAATTNVFLPLTGTLATRENVETLSQKTLDAPKITGLGNYANDAAAASGGVPVDGVYRNGSVLMVRVS